MISSHSHSHRARQQHLLLTLAPHQTRQQHHLLTLATHRARQQHHLTLAPSTHGNEKLSLHTYVASEPQPYPSHGRSDKAADCDLRKSVVTQIYPGVRKIKCSPHACLSVCGCQVLNSMIMQACVCACACVSVHASVCMCVHVCAVRSVSSLVVQETNAMHATNCVHSLSDSPFPPEHVIPLLNKTMEINSRVCELPHERDHFLTRSDLEKLTKNASVTRATETIERHIKL